jgi:hypothetical protein
MLEACFGAGVLGVHAGVDTAAPARGDLLQEVISTAEHPPELVVVVRGHAEGAGQVIGPKAGPLRERESVGRPVRALLEIPFEAAPADMSRPPGVAEPGESAGPVFHGWGVGFGSPPTTTDLARALQERPDWVRFPYHMLSPPSVEELLGMARKAGVPVVGSDPFGGGRLDGSHVRGSPLEMTGRPAPSDWAAVRRTWAPVLALGFLTSGRVRTLPQAALQYVLGTPGVAAVLVPAPEPGALVEAGAALRLPSIDPADRARVAGIRGVRSDSPRTVADLEFK